MESYGRIDTYDYDINVSKNYPEEKPAIDHRLDDDYKINLLQMFFVVFIKFLFSFLCLNLKNRVVPNNKTVLKMPGPMRILPLAPA